MLTSGILIRTLLGAWLFVMCTAVLQGSPTETDDTELQVRAAFLLNFMKFTTWPDEAFVSQESPLVFAVVGRDPFGRILEQTFSREKVGTRQISIRRLPLPNRDDYQTLQAYEDAVAQFRRNVQTAHVTYFADCDAEQLEYVLNHVDTRFMLTVGDERSCADQHTALALDRDGSRIIFYANIQKLNGLDLQVSSRLLSLARIIDEGRTAR
jgi:hypothetical protein